MPPPLRRRLQENPKNKSRAPPYSFALKKQLLEIHRNFRSIPNSRKPREKLKFSNFTAPISSDSQTKNYARKNKQSQSSRFMWRYSRDHATPGGFLPATTFCPSLIHHIPFVILPSDFQRPHSVHFSSIIFRSKFHHLVSGDHSVPFLIQHIPSQFFHLVYEDPFRPFLIHQISVHKFYHSVSEDPFRPFNIHQLPSVILPD